VYERAFEGERERACEGVRESARERVCERACENVCERACECVCVCVLHEKKKESTEKKREKDCVLSSWMHGKFR
jgi:hypothetical protein